MNTALMINKIFDILTWPLFALMRLRHKVVEANSGPNADVE